MVSSSFSDTAVGIGTASMNTIGIDTMVQLPGTVMLPPVRSEAFISQRHEVNPALALSLLNDIHMKVLQWQDQLRQIVQALHTLHAQGPMVEGWIESSADVSNAGHAPDATVLRHGDTDTLLQYIDSLDHRSNESVAAASQSIRTEYRLCRLDESGQVRSQPCPAEQMGVVSIAIARYQKFKQLLDQKEILDAKLKQAVDQLTSVRASI